MSASQEYAELVGSIAQSCAKAGADVHEAYDQYNQALSDFSKDARREAENETLGEAFRDALSYLNEKGLLTDSDYDMAHNDHLDLDSRFVDSSVQMSVAYGKGGPAFAWFVEKHADAYPALDTDKLDKAFGLTDEVRDEMRLEGFHVETYPNGMPALLRGYDYDRVVYSVNLDSPLQNGHTIFLDVNNLPDYYLEDLKGRGIVRETGQSQRSGYVEFPLAVITEPTLTLDGYDESKQNNGTGTKNKFALLSTPELTDYLSSHDMYSDADAFDARSEAVSRMAGYVSTLGYAVYGDEFMADAAPDGQPYEQVGEEGSKLIESFSAYTGTRIEKMSPSIVSAYDALSDAASGNVEQGALKIKDQVIDLTKALSNMSDFGAFEPNHDELAGESHFISNDFSRLSVPDMIDYLKSHKMADSDRGAAFDVRSSVLSQLAKYMKDLLPWVDLDPYATQMSAEGVELLDAFSEYADRAIETMDPAISISYDALSEAAAGHVVEASRQLNLEYPADTLTNLARLGSIEPTFDDWTGERLLMSGTCGTVKWSVSDTGKLCMRQGKLDNILSCEESPWRDVNDRIKSIYIPTGEKVFASDACNGLFTGCSNLTDVKALSQFDVTQAKSMIDMFAFCEKLEDISALSQWNVFGVSDMRGMFERCSPRLRVSDIKDWQIAPGTKTVDMFAYLDTRHVCEAEAALSSMALHGLMGEASKYSGDDSIAPVDVLHHLSDKWQPVPKYTTWIYDYNPSTYNSPTDQLNRHADEIIDQLRDTAKAASTVYDTIQHEHLDPRDPYDVAMLYMEASSDPFWKTDTAEAMYGEANTVATPYKTEPDPLGRDDYEMRIVSFADDFADPAPSGARTSEVAVLCKKSQEGVPFYENKKYIVTSDERTPEGSKKREADGKHTATKSHDLRGEEIVKAINEGMGVSKTTKSGLTNDIQEQITETDNGLPY